jgi:hypothetical protein
MDTAHHMQIHSSATTEERCISFTSPSCIVYKCLSLTGRARKPLSYSCPSTVQADVTLSSVNSLIVAPSSRYCQKNSNRKFAWPQIHHTSTCTHRPLSWRSLGEKPWVLHEQRRSQEFICLAQTISSYHLLCNGHNSWHRQKGTPGFCPNPGVNDCGVKVPFLRKKQNKTLSTNSICCHHIHVTLTARWRTMLSEHALLPWLVWVSDRWWWST